MTAAVRFIEFSLREHASTSYAPTHDALDLHAAASHGASGDRSLSETSSRTSPNRRTRLRDLLELYVEELSEIFPVERGPDGRFGYERLQPYWTEPGVRHAFVIASYTSGAYVERQHSGAPRGWHIFTFASTVWQSSPDPAGA